MTQYGTVCRSQMPACAFYRHPGGGVASFQLWGPTRRAAAFLCSLGC